MMNENSPTCAMHRPARSALRVPRPARNAPRLTPSTLPPITSAASVRTVSQCSRSGAGSISIPTETKNSAANVSRTGSTSFSMRSP